MSNYKPIDGRYHSKKELETRLLLMGVNFFNHLLESKGDFVDVYNDYVHNPYYARKIKTQLKNDSEEHEIKSLAGNKLTARKRHHSIFNENDSDFTTSNRKNTNLTSITKRTRTTTKKQTEQKRQTRKKANSKKPIFRAPNGTFQKDTSKKSESKNVHQRSVSEESIEIDLIGDGDFTKGKSSSNINSKNLASNKSLSKNTYNTKISTNSKNQDSDHKKIYEVLFPQNNSIKKSKLKKPTDISTINNELNLNDVITRHKSSNKKDSKYNVIVNRLTKINKKAKPEEQSKTKTDKVVKEVKEEKTEKVKSVRKSNFIKNLANQTKKQIKNLSYSNEKVPLSSKRKNSRQSKQSTNEKHQENENRYSNYNNINNNSNDKREIQQHINVICNVNNSKSGKEFTLGKQRIPRNMFTSTSGQKQNNPVKNLKDLSSDVKPETTIKVSKIVRSSNKKLTTETQDSDFVNTSKVNNYTSDNYLTKNKELYEKLGLKSIKMKEEVPFNVSQSNKDFKKDKKEISAVKSRHSASNMRNNMNNINNFNNMNSSQSKNAFNNNNNNNYYNHTNAYNVGDDNSSSIDSSVFKIQKMTYCERFKNNFLFKDFSNNMPGINPAYLLKLGLSGAIIATTCYYFANKELQDKLGAMFSFALEKYFGVSEIYVGNKLLITMIVVFCIYQIFIQATLYHLKLKNARENYNILLEISNEEEFPNEDDFLISESNVIKKFSSQANMTTYVYEHDIYPLLKYIIQEGDFFYFEEIDGENYLKIKQGARSTNEEDAVNEFVNDIEIIEGEVQEHENSQDREDDEQEEEEDDNMSRM